MNKRARHHIIHTSQLVTSVTSKKNNLNNPQPTSCFPLRPPAAIPPSLPLLPSKVFRHRRSNGRPPPLVARHDTGAPLGRRVLGATVIGQEIRDGRDERGPRGRQPGDRVARGQGVVVVFVEGIDVGAGELPGRDSFGEEDVQFVEGAVLWFREF